MNARALLLASASPRRRELLAQLGVSCEVRPADIDETPAAGEAPADYVARMAREKCAAAVAALGGAQALGAPPRAVLAADTTVVIDGDILGKPADRLDGLVMLARLSGRRHEVMTGVCLDSGSGPDCELVTTQVEFATLSRAQCEAYLATGEADDKAGAYGIQGLGGAFVSSLSGSYSNVVGLPLHETWQLLAAHGVATGLSVQAG